MPDNTFGPQGWTPARLGNLEGKTYLITGANAGAGFQAARTLLKKNAKVVMLNRSAEKSQTAVAELKSEFGSDAEVSFVRMDYEFGTEAFAGMPTWITELIIRASFKF